MRCIAGSRTFLAAVLLSTALACGAHENSALLASPARLVSETPARFEEPTDAFDYVRRVVAIPMRDGVKLNTVIVIPKNAKRAPMLLTRTPYSAEEQTSHASSSHMSAILQGFDNPADTIVEAGYIRVVQDVRGKYDSEGEYVMTRPLRGVLNTTQVDHATDTWDTIEWLSKNVPESNGKVGIIGISYDGFTSLMALVNPHPALKAVVPMNPMVDGWRGDDWFHNGAFQQLNLPYILEQEATRKNDVKWFSSHADDYEVYLRAGSIGQLGRSRGAEQVGFWRKLLEHPAYDAFWQAQAVDKILAQQRVKVPTLLVHSLWDAEDIYGDIAVYKAIKPHDVDNDKVFLVLGPWSHGGEIGDGSRLGVLRFGSDTALQFRREILRPFLDHFLRDDAPPMHIPPVSAFETGTNQWRQLSTWPSGCVNGCGIEPTPLHMAASQRADFVLDARARGYEEFVSDPAKPVPFRQRPIPPAGYDESKGQTWPRWLVDDQREASGRTDVLTWTTDRLATAVKISGEPVAHLMASTSGTDSDWVVKVIDVYPDEVPAQPELGGYQLMVSADIFRGRYREGLEVARPIVAGAVLPYTFALPTANHVFLPGHRIMVQVQSSWFPLYDRNPQTFVDNIFMARPEDYQSSVQRIYFGTEQDSYVELPVVRGVPETRDSAK